MSQKSEGTQGFALLTTFTLVGVAVAGVIGFNAMKNSGASLGGASESPAATHAAGPTGDAKVTRVYFDVADAASLSAEASDAVVRAAEAARANTAAVIHIVPFHDASGDAGVNSELARRRAWRVHHALESNGVPPQQLVMNDPRPTATGSDPKEARRVEMRMQ